MILGLTTRQACESMFKTFDRNSLLCDKWMGMLGKIFLHDEESGPLVVPVQELKECSLLTEGLGFGRLQLFDDGYEKNISGAAYPLTFTFLQERWVERRSSMNTILDYVHNQGGVFITDVFGSTVMEKVRAAGYATILSYCKAYYDYGVTSASASLVIEYKGKTYHVCDFSIVDEECFISNICTGELFDEVSYLTSYIGLCSTINGMYASIALALSNELCTPADISAILAKYSNSSWSSVREYARDLSKAGSTSVTQAISNFVAMFRGANDVTENDDGSITWNAPGSSISNVTGWAVIKQVVSTSLQIIGSALLLAGNVALKLVGGALMLAGSLLQSVMNFAGSVTGTTPFINDEAIDDVYADPVYQGKESIKLSFLKNANDTLESLRDNGRVKIILPYAIIYMYNAAFTDEEVTVEYKVFPRMHSFYTPWSIGTKEDGYEITAGVYIDDQHRAWIRTLQFDASEGEVGMNFVCDEHLQEFFEKIDDKFANSVVQNLTTASADGADWTPFWLTLGVNTLLALISVLCSPFYRWKNDWWPTFADNGSKYTGAFSKMAGFYFTWLTSPYTPWYVRNQYANFLNGVGQLAGINHDDENILFCLLYSNGIIDLTKSELSNLYPSKECWVKTQFGPAFSIRRSTTADVAFTGANLETQRCRYYSSYSETLPLIAIDKQAYATPPVHNYKSLLWAAIIATAIVAVVVIGTVVVRTMIKRRIKPAMIQKGQELARDGQVYRTGFTSEEWNQLPDEDKREYIAAQRKYIRKVNRYNIVANLLGMSSLDWMNNWYNAYEAPGAIAPIAQSTEGLSISELAENDTIKQVTTTGLENMGIQVSSGFDDTEISLGTILYSITGRQPQ